jgi:hypothetical protein
MPIEIARTTERMTEALGFDRSTRAEAWAVRIEHALDHPSVMEAWADAWHAWTSAARRGVLTLSHRDAVLRADAARAASVQTLAGIRPVAGDAQTVATQEHR